MNATDFHIVLPEVILSLYALGALLFTVYAGKDALTGVVTWATAGLFVALAVWIGVAGDGTNVAVGGMFTDDAFARFAKVTVLLSAAGVLVMAQDYMVRNDMGRFEYPILVALAVVGMMVMVSAGDLMSLYLGLELQSLALYVVASIRRDSVKSTEAGLKYFVLGSLSSGLLLYGASLVYGYAGTTQFAGILSTLGGAPHIGVVIGLVFLLSGLAFKVSAAPFHMWTPDVYEGAPTPVTAFFASAPKVAAIALLMRVVLEAFGSQVLVWQQIIIAVALMSIIIGAVGAIGQQNLKRLMAYSSINNVGFILIGLATGTEQGIAAMLVYLTIYVAMTLGGFVCLMQLKDKDGNYREEFADIAGLSKTRPALAAAFAIFMFSLAGIPPLFGFWGKLVVFNAAVAAAKGVRDANLAAIGPLPAQPVKPEITKPVKPTEKPVKPVKPVKPTVAPTPAP